MFGGLGPVELILVLVVRVVAAVIVGVLALERRR